MSKHTPGPWVARQVGGVGLPGQIGWAIDYNAAQEQVVDFVYEEADAALIAAAPDLLEALHEGRRAIGDHFAPNDCYATGPMTGNPYRDLVQCPACSFIAMYEAAITKANNK